MSEHSLTQGYASSEDTVSKENNNSEMGAQVSVSKSKESGKASGAFRTISEVADLLDVQQHVLRFWETKFSQVKPLKRGGGRRYYRPDDVAILQKIHHLLYSEGYTIKGVQKLLKGQSKGQIVSDLKRQTTKAPMASNDQEKMAVAASQAAKAGLSANQKALLEDTLGDLKALKAMVTVEE